MPASCQLSARSQLSSAVEGFAVLARYWHKHGLPPARLRKVNWLEDVHRYWRVTGHWYYASTEICTGSVLALLQCRLLAETWSRNWGCTMPVPRQPLASYQLSSTSIAPCLQLARYCSVCKYWHESEFSTWDNANEFSFHNFFSKMIIIWKVYCYRKWKSASFFPRKISYCL